VWEDLISSNMGAYFSTHMQQTPAPKFNPQDSLLYVVASNDSRIPSS